MLKIGLATIVVIFAISIIAVFINRQGFKIMISRAVFWGILGLGIWLIPWQKQLECQYRNHPDYVTAAIDAYSNPGDEQLREKMEAERRRIK